MIEQLLRYLIKSRWGMHLGHRKHWTWKSKVIQTFLLASAGISASFCILSARWASWPVLFTQQDLTAHHPWILPITMIATHILRGRTSTYSVLQVGCAEREYPIEWHTYSGGHQELGTMIGESQNTTWREQFACLTASVSAWIGSSWKEPRETQFFWL